MASATVYIATSSAYRSNLRRDSHMRTYKARKCPGCGKEAPRQAQELCPACRRLLELGKERQAEIEQMRADPDKLVVGIDEDFLYTPPRSVTPVFQPITAGQMLRALTVLAQMEDVDRHSRSDRHIYFESSLYHHHPVVRGWFSATQADALQTILDYMNQMFRWYFNEGLRVGKSLLHELAQAGARELNRVSTNREKPS